MKLRRQQQVERELNGYRAWIDRAGTEQLNNFTCFITVNKLGFYPGLEPSQFVIKGKILSGAVF